MRATLGKELLKHIERVASHLYSCIVIEGSKIEQRTVKTMISKIK